MGTSMNSLSSIKMLPKLTAVIALIGVIVGGCVWFAQCRMTQIDDGHIQRAFRQFTSAECRRYLAAGYDAYDPT